ncbi:MAG: alpha/beta fold hydrolase [Akkermansiaceae bacterium]|jgi:triacylglycerol lipase|nr:alpha/beta fold hydrolase [Akkermansiaceae bacterium]
MIRTLLLPLISLPCLAASEWQPPSEIRHAVLVHGIWENEHRAFRSLRAELEARGIHCVVPSLKPATAIHGIRPLATQLDAAVRLSLPKDERFIVIAHSMGGLVSRAWLQDLGGIRNCDALITIASPHHGTRMAYAHPGQGAAEMRPGSAFLAELQATEDHLEKLPILSYRTPWDGVIVPHESSVWPRATNVEIACFLHARMTAHPALHADLFDRLKLPPAPALAKRAEARRIISRPRAFPR